MILKLQIYFYCKQTLGCSFYKVEQSKKLTLVQLEAIFVNPLIFSFCFKILSPMHHLGIVE